MRASRSGPLPFVISLIFWVIPTLNAASAATYTSTPLAPVDSRQYIDLNNRQYALTMRQDAPGHAFLSIVVENRKPGSYAESRPGTLPGTTRSIATDFNDSQAIVGWAETFDNNGNPTAKDRAFLYRNGVFTDLSALPPLNSPGNLESHALGINNSGDVVGYWRDSTGRRHGFLYSNGTITDLGAFNPNGVGGTEARAINDSKQITGYSFSASAGARQSSAHAYFYSAGSMRDLDPLPAGLQSLGIKINAGGETIGVAKTSTHAQSCFIYTAGAVKTIPTLGQTGDPFCSVASINRSGVVVGQSTTAVYPPKFLTRVGFVYRKGVSTDLNSLINPTDNLAVNRVGIRSAVAINDAGYIIVQAGNMYYLLTPETVRPPTDSE